MAEPKKPVDWDAIEPHYRAGVLSFRELGEKFEVSPAGIVKHAKRHGWTRNLEGKIRAKADAKVNAALVNAEVNAKRAATEQATIEVNADAIATIRLGHRKDIRTGRELVAKLLAELTGITERPDLIDELQHALLAEDLAGAVDDIDIKAAKGRAERLRDALDRVAGIGGRIAGVKGLAEAMKNLIALERQAWNIDQDEGDREASGRDLSDVERATRLASIMERAQRAKAGQQ